MRKKMFGKKFMGKIGALFMAAVLGGATGGCSSSSVANTDVDGSAVQEENGSSTMSDMQVTENGNNSSDSASNTGLGRYVEKTVLEISPWSNVPVRIQSLEDGSLAMFSISDGMYISKDQGDTWELKNVDWLAEYAAENYTDAYVMSKNGDVILGYTPLHGEGSVEEAIDDNWSVYCMMIAPDGTQNVFDVDLTNDERYVRDFCMDDTSGKLYAFTFSDTIYELNMEEQSKQAVVNIPGSHVYIACKNNLLMCATTDKVYFYDLLEKSFIEDDVLQDFIKENYSNIDNSNAGSYNVLVFLGEDNGDDRVVYIAGKKGLHRHVVGGSAVEQVIDGSLSSLGDPSHAIEDAVLLNDQEFLVKYSDGKLVKFTYDATVSAVPNDRIKVYSLTENDTIRQAISTYQTANPQMYVQYEIGIESNGVTKEDALKKLNTSLLDGTGPDVLILDEILLDSYIDKGILMDISEVAEGLDATDGLFTNLITPFYYGENLYVVPTEFKLPAIAGHESALGNISDYKDIADLFERLREEYPEKDLLGKCSETGIMKSFIEICEPSWKKGNSSKDGGIDEALLKEFLEQSKRIYTAQMSGLSNENISSYQERNEYYVGVYGTTYENSRYFNKMNEFAYFLEETPILCGDIDSASDYNTLHSLSRKEGFEDSVWQPLDGQSSNVYVPMTMVGINAATKNREQAIAFLQTILGQEVQKQVFYGYPINKKAFENFFTVDESLIADDGGYSYVGGSTENGLEVQWTVYAPNEEQMQMLKDWVAKVDTPYLCDSVLEEAVYSEGAKYLRGEIDLDTAVKKIMDSVMIYLSE